jgi:hypothetical protein
MSSPETADNCHCTSNPSYDGGPSVAMMEFVRCNPEPAAERLITVLLCLNLEAMPYGHRHEPAGGPSDCYPGDKVFHVSKDSDSRTACGEKQVRVRTTPVGASRTSGMHRCQVRFLRAKVD